MSTALNEITFQRLNEFRRRRIALAASRGWSAVVTVFVTTLLLAVFIDAFSTNDRVRWIASSLMYLATLGTWYWCCRHSFRTSDSLLSEAQRFEEVDPRLREQLLTAVEFADESRSQRHDSSAFKDQLQSQVAHLVAPVDVRQLLPWRMVSRWLFVAATALAVLVLLGFIPQLHWMNRVARALLPAANLDRVARVAITIEEPQPRSKTIATGEMLGILVRIDGPSPDRVLIESRSAAGDATVVPMQKQSTDGIVELASGPSAPRYHATISTDLPWIEYRVTASGAATAWHRLTTQPRPDVRRFKKILTPPAYSLMPQIVQDDPDGNIRALIGTRVQLALELNQPVNVAELRWQSANVAGEGTHAAVSLGLEQDTDTGHYCTEFTVARNDSYRVHLQSAETGFVNDFSPSFTVEAITDEKPVVVWTKPASAKEIVASDQILSLAAQIQDEMPVGSLKQLARINHDGIWAVSVIDPKSFKPGTVDASHLSSGARSLTDAQWQADLLPFSLRVGDVMEMKLVADDRHGQSVESDIVEFLISESTITTPPTPAEQLRQEVAAELDAFAQRIKQQQQALQDIVKPKSVSAGQAKIQPSEEQLNRQSTSLVEVAATLGDAVAEAVPELLKLIERAAAQTEDSASLLELEQAGQILSVFKTKRMKELQAVTQRLAETDAALPAKQRGELEKEIVEHSHRLEQASHLVAEGFRAMVSHDVGRRVSQQVAKLEQLFDSFGASEPPHDVEQNRRQAVVLSRQLMELQQTMLDSLPSVRQDTKSRLRQTADAIGNLVSQVESMNPKADVAEVRKQTEQIKRSLSQMGNASWFDGGLHDAIINGHRRFAEFGGQPADQLRRAITNLVNSDGKVGVEIKTATIDTALEDLRDRRALMRSRKAGDREFASDLGNAARALREITQNESLTRSDQQRELSQTAASLETLQAVHGINEAVVLLEDLLRGERWSLNTSDAIINHPILFDSFSERLENAVKLLRQAKVPNELVDNIERLRWQDATGKAGQKINSRRWENSLPVSAAPELNQVSEQLAAAASKLEPLTLLARAKIAEQTPALGELAQKAAAATHKLQQQTESLAKAVQRNEVPNEAAQLAQLKSEQQQATQPIAELRDALVDHADSQNLLQEKQLVSAHEADAALAVVDVAQQEIDASMQMATAPAESSEQAQSLDLAAVQQAGAAEKLDKLAEHFGSRDTSTGELSNQPEVSQSLMQLANELGANAEAQQRYNEAAQLARLAAAKPEEVLRQLEQKLAQSPPMQQEMSRISKELAEQALNRLDRAANQQQKMQPALEASDPTFQAQKKLLLQDLQTVRENANQILSLLVSEAKWTAGAGKEEVSQKQIESVENQLRSALTAAEKASNERTFQELRDAADTLAQSLQAANETLDTTSQKLHDASGREVHQNDADLANRRREMNDRQRRIAQQDIRNLQQAERQQQQLLRQAENDLKQTEQRERSLEQHLANVKKEADKHPENASLKQPVIDAERNLGYGQVQKRAAEQAKQQLMHRVETATQNRDTSTKQQPAELSSVNPSAQLSAELARIAAERSRKLAKQLDPWHAAPANELRPEANVAQLQNSSHEELTVRQSVQDSAEDLSRASRHEQRLKSTQASQQLSIQSTATENLNRSEVKNAEQALSTALENSKRPEAPTGQASAENTQTALNNMQAADTAIRSRADQLRTMLAGLNKQPTAKPNAGRDTGDSDSESALLDSQQLARLLDEVDRQLNLGEKDMDAPSQSATPSNNKPTPSTLAAAAEQISSQLSRNRQPPPQANTDQAMATESTSANVDPQGPVAVKVFDVNRPGADWGKLRERAAEEMLESKRETVSPAFRQQIEAYFRSLAERGQSLPKQ